MVGASMKSTALALILIVIAPGSMADQKYWGGGKDFGKGWTVDDRGNIRGTGKNFGKGYQTDKSGTLYGTGKSFGERWTPSKQGGGSKNLPPR